MATTFSYTYSKRTKQALIWTPNCWRYKTLVEEKLEKPTTCLLNLYHTGTEGMGWHSDAEKNLKNGAIASVSFGAKNLPSNTETARKRYHRTYPRQLVSDERRNPNSLAAPLTSHYTHYYS
jgi:alkylated DNA repair dioxygenase AlkB